MGGTGVAPSNRALVLVRTSPLAMHDGLENAGGIRCELARPTPPRLDWQGTPSTLLEAQRVSISGDSTSRIDACTNCGVRRLKGRFRIMKKEGFPHRSHRFAARRAARAWRHDAVVLGIGGALLDPAMLELAFCRGDAAHCNGNVHRAFAAPRKRRACQFEKDQHG